MRDDESGFNAGSVMLSFLLGSVVGAGVALLLAPKSGEETRRQIRDLAEEAKDKAGGYIGQAKAKMDSVFDEGKGFIEEKKSIIAAAVEAGREAYEREKERQTKEQNA